MSTTQQQALEAYKRIFQRCNQMQFPAFADLECVRQYIEQGARADVVLRELVEADKAWQALHPIHRLNEIEKGETRLAAAWKAARAFVAPQPQQERGQ